METKRLSNAAGGPIFPLGEMFQHYGHTGRTGMFIVNFDNQQGSIYLMTGIVAHAETNTLSGEAAVWEMLSHPGATYEWIESETPRQMTMSSLVQDILLRSIQIQNSGEMEQIRADAIRKTKTRSIQDTEIIHLITLELSSREITPFNFVIQTKQVRVGRHAENELVLSDSSVSRKHAILIQNNDALLVRDLGSMNGLRVDGQPVIQGLARNDQVLHIGEVLAKISVSKMEQTPAMAAAVKKETA